MEIETHQTHSNDGYRIVKRYRKGRCYACVWSFHTEDKQIQHDMQIGDAAFFPYNESTGEFMFHLANKPIHFRR